MTWVFNGLDWNDEEQWRFVPNPAALFIWNDEQPTDSPLTPNHRPAHGVDEAEEKEA